MTSNPFANSSPVSLAEYQQAEAENWLEDALQAKILRAARPLGWLAYHTHDSRRSQPGYPDLHLVHPIGGRSLFRELKKQKRANPTPDQLKWLAALKLAGFDVGVWRPLDFINGSIIRELQCTTPLRPDERKAPR